MPDYIPPTWVSPYPSWAFPPGYQPQAPVGVGQLPGGNPGYAAPGMGGIPATGGSTFGSTNPTYNPFGGGGGGFDQAFSGGGGSGRTQQTMAWLLPLIANLGQGYLANRAQGRSEEANREAIQDRIRAALATLSPQNIAMLSRAFLPQIMAQLNPQMQTAIQALNTSQGRRGLFQSPIGLAQESGLRGQLAQAGPTQAFQQAMQLAGQQAGVLTGLPIQQTQPNLAYANAFGNAFNQALAGYALSDRTKRQPEPPSPYATFGGFGGRGYA